MEIKLIEGEFKTDDAVKLLTQMIHAKVKFHEDKIGDSHLEEDIKARETKIKRLQKDLYELRKFVDTKDGRVSISAVASVS